MLESARGNMRAAWKVINEILNKKKTAKTELDHLCHDNKIYTQKVDIANIFNTFFYKCRSFISKKNFKL